jgi:coenzyme F420-reducing hydrogenase delta subunit
VSVAADIIAMDINSAAGYICSGIDSIIITGNIIAYCHISCGIVAGNVNAVMRVIGKFVIEYDSIVRMRNRNAGIVVIAGVSH